MGFGAQTHGVWSANPWRLEWRRRQGSSAHRLHPSSRMRDGGTQYSTPTQTRQRDAAHNRHVTGCVSLRLQKYTNTTNKTTVRNNFIAFTFKTTSSRFVLFHVVMLTHRQERRNGSKFSVVRMVLGRFYKSNKRKAFTYRAFRLFMGWVAGGTRTHDIQNHNLTL